MNHAKLPTSLTLAGAALAVGLAVGFLAGQGTSPPAVAQAVAARPNPQTRNLDANLWAQTSAEYHACCLQTYRLAGERLRARLAKLPKEGLPPAVILDLDETVIDSAAFQTWMYRWAVPYNQGRWDRWEEGYPGEVGPVPGAVEFIRDAEKVGAAVFFITNRNQSAAESTRKALDRLGVNTKGFATRHLGRTKETGGDKQSRRAAVRKGHRVLMLVGDNLLDLSSEFKAAKVNPTDGPGLRKAIAERKRKVDLEQAKFGEEWVILPNPVYGEWAKLQGADPLEVLHLSRMPGP